LKHPALFRGPIPSLYIDAALNNGHKDKGYRITSA
jgi:hypothetical protein